MIELSLVGIGTGNPEHLTRAAIRALNDADLILLPRKGSQKAELLELRRLVCADILTRPVTLAEFDLPVRSASGEYLGGVRDWHAAIAQAWAAQITAHLPQGGRVALMVWGDPSLYDSSLRIAARLGAGGMALRVSVVPGITSLSALTAAHGVALNTLGAPVMITTGRQLRDGGWPAGVDSVAVMLDAGSAFEVLDAQGVHIWWGAYLSMPQQVLVAGPLADVGARITALRADLRAEHGWIMDIYLLRR
ncbi:precorrin-6A synthase (deacetylating) [Roseinatronobacter alkalisoli]|uniref:Precorrin-6A synthase [deacetylating] n=1 Tax=Roseinatronobacter alkalisoli TaxID=3028235 RepID=A0ABT5T6X0_9RHOB|nr:precorrin-6A synthase (deacetylating) [Roseinatronobacter sp. HJB301]MDD7970794.1 precorrin-6A synthase (deacetylating) [Roseinatronobacter sp. HJB301]